MSGKKVATGKRKASFQNNKGKKQQKSDDIDHKTSVASSADEVDEGQNNLGDSKIDQAESSSEHEKPLDVEEKQLMEGLEDTTPLENSSQLEASVKDCETSFLKCRSIELFKLLEEFVACLDKTSSLSDEATNTEDLIMLCQKISKELRSNATDVQPYLSDLKRVKEKIVSLIDAKLKTISTLNPKDQTAKNTSEEIPESLVNTDGEYNQEFLRNKILTVVSQIDHRLHRSTALLNGDPTVLGSINQPEIQKQLNNDAQNAFRDFYMDCVTETFGDELNKLREEDDFTQSRLAMLIDSIEAGMSLFPESDRALLTYTKPIQE